MPSFTTVFRAVVMLVVAAVGVKGWQLYGPTNEQVKTVVAQGVELVKSRLASQKPATPDPRNAAPPLATANPIAPIPGNLPAPATLSPSEPPQLLPSSSAGLPAMPQKSEPAAPAFAQSAVQTPATTSDPMTGLMTKLQQLGAADTNLSPWGDGGHLYRFSCKAPLPAVPSMTQHFESVANEPTVAVEQVIAKVEAWRVAQRDESQLRY